MYLDLLKGKSTQILSNCQYGYKSYFEHYPLYAAP
jgi:hypothetical protein